MQEVPLLALNLPHQSLIDTANRHLHDKEERNGEQR